MFARSSPGIGPVLAAVIIAEVGDVTRFATAAQLASWAGLTPEALPGLRMCWPATASR
jgi:transposase